MTAKPLQLLLVEDDPAHAELIRRAFLLYDRQVHLTVVCSVREARAMLTTMVPDLAIIDILLPDGRGLELLSGDERTATFPAVVMTSHGNEQAAVEAIKTGAVDYVVKSEATLADMPHIAERALRAWGHITAGKRLEAQLRQAQKMEAIGTLAGGIAHDFNNLLAAILGYTELALHAIHQDSDVSHYLQEVHKAGQRAKILVQQILTFSRRTEQTRTPVRLSHLVEEALALLRASLPSTIAMRHQISQDAGTVLADPTQLQQVLLNLGANAEYAMRQTGGLLEIRLEPVEVDEPMLAQHPELQAGPYVCITVTDTGHGMTPDVVERIFEPFFTTKGPGEGTGMGLALVHGIVASHGGVVTVASVVGQGTTFTVYLPRTDASVPDEAAQEGTLPTGVERVLFVDDEESLVGLGQEILGLLGYDVVVCTGSVEALEVFRMAPQSFDLVITDQTMPYMTGEELARELRRLRADIPIILCTGFSHIMQAEKAQELGIDAFLLKPLAIQDLARVIQQVLEPRRLPPP
ncbi:MAG TPA: response regulator [Candidatus Tectomicrobia bacterium]|jgi:signal transduction histidine kinase